MRRVSLLLDENQPPRLKTALLRFNAMIDVGGYGIR
jgi:hypothetical protein